MRLQLSFSLLLLVAEMVAAQTPAPITVPFETFPSQHMVVSAKVNGEGPFRFIFDTGAPDSIMSTKVAKQAKVYDKDFKKPLFTMFGAQGQVKLRSLELGDVKAENLSAMVVDHPLIDLMRKEFGPLDGILGFTFFGRYRLTIDYEKKTLTFTPTDYQPKNIMEQMMKKLMARTGPNKAKPSVIAPEVWLGLQVATAEEGVRITHVHASGPAEKAGFRKEDLLLRIDGSWTDSVADTHQILTRLRADEPVTAVLIREGKKISVPITPVSGW